MMELLRLDYLTDEQGEKPSDTSLMSLFSLVLQQKQELQNRDEALAYALPEKIW
jgi:hypothetical protein